MTVMARVVVLAMAMAVLDACGGGDKSVPDSASGAAGAPVDSLSADPAKSAVASKDYVGEADPPRCSITDGGCKGTTSISLDVDPGRAAAFVRALDADSADAWSLPSAIIPRRTVDGQKNATLRIRAIADAKAMALKDLANFTVVVGRIDVISISSKEQFFDISVDDASKVANRFYVIAKGFKREGPTADSTVPFGEWRLYGVVNGRLRPFGKKRKFSGCIIPHDDRTRMARFTTCLKQPKLHALEQLPAFSVMRKAQASSETVLDRIRANLPNQGADVITGASVRAALRAMSVNDKSLSDAQIEQIITMLDDESLDPFWLTCGVGCCTTGT